MQKLPKLYVPDLLCVYAIIYGVKEVTASPCKAAELPGAQQAQYLHIHSLIYRSGTKLKPVPRTRARPKYRQTRRMLTAFLQLPE